jgi:nucleoid DNA-binding protein
MGKITIQDLASAIVERWHIGKKEASMFVNELFFVIQKSLDEDKIVKVKGLGTFKIIDVDDRESVNVNTGDRVLIEGHGKITFTPDTLMKELVNKPFSQFETVVLKDGVDFNGVEEIKQPEETADSDEIEDSSAPLVEFVDEPQTEIVEKSETQEEPIVPQEPVEPESSEPEPVIPDSPEEEDIASEETPEESEEPESSDEPETVEEESAFKKYYKWIGMALLTLAIGVLIGYLMGNRFQNPSQTSQESSTETVEKETVKSLPKDSDTIKMDTEVEEETMEDDEEDVEDDEVELDDVDAKEEKTSLDKWEAMDARVRTGAYRIIGTDQVLKARTGDNLARICRRTLGPGMECYIEVYNGISKGTEIKAGQEIKIPKLELKKKRKK